MADYEIKVGTISWISRQPNPVWTTAQAGLLNPGWVPKTYLGLAATSNAVPDAKVPDFRGFTTAKDYRALLFCHLRFTVDDVSDRVQSTQVVDALVDKGWTPPYRLGDFPLSGITGNREILFGFSHKRGQRSPISGFTYRKRHPNSAIGKIPAEEQVLINGLIKFRAGDATDKIGTETLHAPYHVPWVWCELLVTHQSGKIKLYGRASIFPSHAWYLNGRRLLSRDQVGDTVFPMKPATSFCAPPPIARCVSVPSREINLPALQIYPVLSAGASASGTQTPEGEDSTRSGSLEAHNHTVSGGKVVSSVWVPTVKVPVTSGTSAH